MPSAKIGEIYGELRVKLNKLQQDLNQSSQKFASWQQKNSKQLQQLASWAKRAEMAIAAIAIASIKLAVDFDRNMREVNTLINLNKEGFNDLKQSVIDLSEELGKDASQMTKALYQVISAGQRGEDAMKTLEAGVKMAIGGIADQTISVDALTTVMNAWGLSAEHVNDITDTFFTTVKLGKTTIGELAPAIGRVATSAAQAGVSFEEVGSALSALTVVGISTDEAVTGLNQMLMAIIKPSEEAQKTSKALGIEFSAQAIQTKGLAGFLKDLKEKTGGSQEALVKLFPSIRAVKAILPLTTNASEQFSNALEIMAKDTGAAQIAFEEMEESYGRRLERLRVQFKNMGIELGERLMPSLEAIIVLLQDPETIEAFSGLATGIVEIVEALTKAVTWFNKFGEVLGKGLGIASVNTTIAEMKIEIQGLKKQFDAGEISAEQYAKGVKYLKDQIAAKDGSLVESIVLQNEDTEKKKKAKEATDNLAERTKKQVAELKKAVEAEIALEEKRKKINEILAKSDNTKDLEEKRRLEQEAWNEEAEMFSERAKLQQEMHEWAVQYKKNQQEIGITAEQAAEQVGELLGTFTKEGMNAFAILKKIVGQQIRLRVLSKMGIGGSLLGGIMQVFGFQEGGVIPKGMPVLNMAMYNENPKRPETAFRTSSGDTAVIPWDKMPQMVKVEIHGVKIDANDQVRALVRANPDAMDEFFRAGIQPAMLRNNQR